MENIISFRKKIIKHESDMEFYLNPKDIFINGKILDNNIQNFFYLTLNELFVVLYDDNISIIDIKESISNEVKIIQSINYRKLYEENFMLEKMQEKEKKSDSKKTSEPKKSSDTKKSSESKIPNLKAKDTINFLSIEDDQSSIKNFLAFEIKEKSYCLCFFIEFLNGDFLLIKFNDIRLRNYQIIYKADKYEHLKTLQSLIKTSNIQSSSADLTDEKLSHSNSSMKYVQLNSQNFSTQSSTNNFSNNSNSNIHLIILRQSKFIFFVTLHITEINPSLTFEVFHKVNHTIIDFVAKMYKNKLIIPQIKEDYNLSVDIFTLTYFKSDINSSNSSNSNRLFNMRMQHYHTQKINFTSSFFLNFLDLDMVNLNSSMANTNSSSIGYSGKVVLLTAKLNQIFIYVLNDDEQNTNFSLINIVNFEGFSNEKRYESYIKYGFLMGTNIVVFNSYGDYAVDTKVSEIFEKIENSAQICNYAGQTPTIIFNNSCYNLAIPKEIFSIKKFQSEMGFFILGTTNIFKIKDFTITYLLPKQFTVQKDLTSSLIQSSRKIFKNNLVNLNNKAHTTFFSHCLNEYLLMFYRNVDLVSHVLLKDVDKIFSQNLTSTDFLFNDYFSLLIWRINFFMKKKKLIQDKEEETDLSSSEAIAISKNYIVDKFRSILSGSIDDDNDEYGFGEYLYSNNYKCEFCDCVFVTYDENKKTYTCSNGHCCLSCCVTFVPLTENQNEKFYLCDECNLIYSGNSFEMVLNDPMIQIKICLICQKILRLT